MRSSTIRPLASRGWRRTAGLLLAAAALAGYGSEAENQRLVEERVERERAEAANMARQEERVRDLQKQVRAAERARRRDARRSSTPAPATPPAPAPPPAAPASSSDDASAPGFNTGTSAGAQVPAAVCRFEGGVYCWTPNDGYTLKLDASGPRRVRGDEPSNRGLNPSSYETLSFDESRSSGGYRCVSASDGLTCTNPAGSGWRLPRYRGLPRLF